MEKRADSIVFRRLTYADFRHINKHGGEEEGGGGQSYIDFPIAHISLKEWQKFLGQKTGSGAGNRPIWEFKINSLGLSEVKDIRIYQRRKASVSIASQKIFSRKTNRVPAWHPNNLFPNKDYDPKLEKLVIYIIKTIDNKFWAGWFKKNEIPKNWIVNDDLKRIFEEDSGYIKFTSKVLIDTEDKEWPFYFAAKTIENQVITEEDFEEELINEDISPKFSAIDTIITEPEIVERIIKIRKRNNRIVKKLKKLYNGKCQISGETRTFKKKNGEYYCEVHHLIPLGEKGSDSLANAIVVSPLIHRMFHYADISEIDLSKIENNRLQIFMNAQPFEITWHPDHLRVVEESLIG